MSAIDRFYCVKNQRSVSQTFYFCFRFQHAVNNLTIFLFAEVYLRIVMETIFLAFINMNNFVNFESLSYYKESVRIERVVVKVLHNTLNNGKDSKRT